MFVKRMCFFFPSLFECWKCFKILSRFCLNWWSDVGMLFRDVRHLCHPHQLWFSVYLGKRFKIIQCFSFICVEFNHNIMDEGKWNYVSLYARKNIWLSRFSSFFLVLNWFQCVIEVSKHLLSNVLFFYLCLISLFVI